MPTREEAKSTVQKPSIISPDFKLMVNTVIGLSVRVLPIRGLEF